MDEITFIFLLHFRVQLVQTQTQILSPRAKQGIDRRARSMEQYALDRSAKSVIKNVTVDF
jgi:hypothetical protein